MSNEFETPKTPKPNLWKRSSIVWGPWCLCSQKKSQTKTNKKKGVNSNTILMSLRIKADWNYVRPILLCWWVIIFLAELLQTEAETSPQLTPTPYLCSCSTSKVTHFTLKSTPFSLPASPLAHWLFSVHGSLFNVIEFSINTYSRIHNAILYMLSLIDRW